MRGDVILYQKKMEEEVEKYKLFVKNVNVFNENMNNLI